jgi:hypothetical protein
VSYLDDRDAREQRERDDKRRERLRIEGMKKAIQDVMAMPQARMLMMAFASDASLDASSFRESPAAMAYVSGWQDAARWWIELIRAYCPERETDMRAEERRRLKQEAREGDTHEDEDAS